MKLEMTLPERPGFLHALPVLNIFALMQLFLLLGPSLVTQSGVAVDLPPSRFQMERYRDTVVVTLGPGEPDPRIHFGRDPVTRTELADRLRVLAEDGARARTVVLLKTDSGTPVGVERDITELVLDKGFRMAIVGKTSQAEGGAVPKLPGKQ